jgi:hypothetical protein
MRFSECPYMNLGSTYYGTDRTISLTDEAAKQLEGTEWWFPDTPPGSLLLNTSPRSNRGRRMRIVRNNCAVNILPSQLVSIQINPAGTNFSQFGQDIDQQVCTTAAPNAYPADEYLPAAGVRPGDLFFICMEGPALVYTPLDGGADNVFNVGDSVDALTAATSQCTTAGRVYPQDLTGATAILGAQIQNRVGKAMSAMTTAQTNALMLIDVMPH